MATSRNAALGRFIVAASLIAVTADNDPKGDVRFRRAIASARPGAGVINKKEETFLKQTCRFGIPKKEPTAAEALGPTTVIIRETYVLEHSAECKTPYWVSELLTKGDLTGPDQGRLKPEPFRPEPWVNKGSRAKKRTMRILDMRAAI